MANEDSTNEVVAEESRGGTKVTCLVMIILIVVAGALQLVRHLA